MRKFTELATGLTTLTLIGTLVGAAFGWIDGALVADIVVGGLALLGLWLLLGLPWDLYFRARGAQVAQRESVARGLEVPPADRAALDRLTPRLLALCVALHVVGAAAMAAVSWWRGDLLGYPFAAGYLLGMGLRPLGALHHHLTLRLRALSDRARFPHEDAVRLRARLDAAEARLKRLDEEAIPSIDQRREELRTETAEELVRNAAKLRALDGKMDRVLGELERSVARLTADKELLAGMRAFVRLVKES